MDITRHPEGPPALHQGPHRMGLETAAICLAGSIHLEVVGAEAVRKSLAADIAEGIGDASRPSQRIQQSGRGLRGSAGIQPGTGKRPPEARTDAVGEKEVVVDVVKVAGRRYRGIVKVTDGEDYVTGSLHTTTGR